MKRDAYEDLLTWKDAPRRKPLLLRGARQTGKTYLLRAFGRERYAASHYFNFEQTPLSPACSSATSIPCASSATCRCSRENGLCPAAR